MFWHVFFFKQKTAYEMRISDWGSDVCASDLSAKLALPAKNPPELPPRQKGAIAVARSRPASLSEPWSACATSSTDAPLPRASQVAVTARSISPRPVSRSEEHTSELQSLMRISYGVFCLQKKTQTYNMTRIYSHEIIYYTVR